MLSVHFTDSVKTAYCDSFDKGTAICVRALFADETLTELWNKFCLAGGLNLYRQVAS